MRTRENRTPGLGQGVQFFAYPDNPSNHTSESSIQDGPVKYERITDQKNGRARPVSPVDHWKIDMSVSTVTNFSASTTSPYGLGFENAYPLVTAVDALGVIRLPSTDAATAKAQQIIRSRYASVAKEWSLLNNLLEIDELPKLIKPIREYRYLDYKFGIEPLVRDLQTLYGNLTGIKAKLKNIRKTSGVSQRFSLKTQVPFEVQAGWGPGWNMYWTIQGTSSLRASGFITVSWPPLDTMLDGVKVALDILGAHLDAGVLYDATPFTWLLDWFIPVGDYIESFVDRRYVRPTVEFRMPCMSVRTEGTILVEQRPGGSYPNFSALAVAKGTFTHYSRGALPVSLNGETTIHPLPAFNIPRLTLDKGLILAGLTKAV